MEDFISKMVSKLNTETNSEESTENVDNSTESNEEVVSAENAQTDNNNASEEVVNNETTETKEEVVEKPKEEVTLKVDKPTEEKVEKKESVKFKASELFEKVDKAIEEKYGMSANEARRIKSLDLEKMSDLDVLKESLKLSDPEITKKELEYKIGKYKLFYDKTDKEIQQMIEDGDLSEKEVDALDAELEGTLRKAVKDLKAKQNEIDLDFELDDFTFDKEENQNVPNQPTEEQIKEVTSAVNSVVESYEKETIKILGKDGEVLQEINYELSNEDRTNIQNLMMNGLNELWTGDDFQSSLKKMAEVALFIKNKDKIVKSIYDQAISKGEEKTVKDINNIDFDSKRSSSDNNSDGLSDMRRVLGQI